MEILVAMSKHVELLH